MLSNSWEFDQLVKIPVLFSHYNEHLSQDQSMSFIGFLKLHYQSDNLEHDQNQDHQNLPFKSHECHNMTQVLTFEVFHPVIEVIASSSLSHMSIYNQDEYLSENVGSIWQPPQYS